MDKIINDTTALDEYLKKMIVETLRLDDINPVEIDSTTPLFKDGLGLDSIDALELVVAIEKNFNVIIEDEDVGKKAFASINALTMFIQETFQKKQ